jgi:hypothetical protein
VQVVALLIGTNYLDIFLETPIVAIDFGETLASDMSTEIMFDQHVCLLPFWSLCCLVQPTARMSTFRSIPVSPVDIWRSRVP